MNFKLRWVAFKARATSAESGRPFFLAICCCHFPLATALVFGLVLHCVADGEHLLIQQQQIVSDRQQVRLRLLGLRTRGRGLLFAGFVFQFVEDLLHVPAAAIKFGEHARRKSGSLVRNS